MPRKGRGAKDERDYKQEPKMYNGGKIKDEPWNSWASSDYPHSGGAYASFRSLADSQTYSTPKAFVPTKPHAYHTAPPSGGGYGYGSYEMCSPFGYLNPSGTYLSFQSLAASQAHPTPQPFVPSNPNAYCTRSSSSYGGNLQDVSGVGPRAEAVLHSGGIHDVAGLKVLYQKSSDPTGFKDNLKAIAPGFRFHHNQMRLYLSSRSARDELADMDGQNPNVDNAITFLDDGVRRMSLY